MIAQADRSYRLQRQYMSNLLHGYFLAPSFGTIKSIVNVQNFHGLKTFSFVKLFTFSIKSLSVFSICRGTRFLVKDCVKHSRMRSCCYVQTSHRFIQLSDPLCGILPYILQKMWSVSIDVITFRKFGPVGPALPLGEPHLL